MSGPEWLLIVGAATLLAGGCLAWKPVRAVRRRPRLAEARRAFHWQRERLEAKFLALAQARRKRGGPHWLDGRFDDDVAYVRNRYTGELSALVAVSIALVEPDAAQGELQQDGFDSRPFDEEAVEHFGGGLRAATAVFRFDRDHWVTDGRAIFFSPSETIRFYQHDLEIVAREQASRG